MAAATCDLWELADEPTREGGGLAVGSEYYGGHHSVHALFHGSNISIPMSSKSRTLRVATAMPHERVIAAIWQSAWETGCPRIRRAE